MSSVATVPNDALSLRWIHTIEALVLPTAMSSASSESKFPATMPVPFEGIG
jgi:hypothetical protein